MSHNEIPEELLSPLRKIAERIEHDIAQAEIAEWSVNIKDAGGRPVHIDSHDAVVRLKQSELFWIAPLIKWLEYLAEVRLAEKRRDAPPNPWAF